MCIQGSEVIISEGCSEVVVMEVAAQAGVRTRGRAMAVEEGADNSGSAKRMKVGEGELRLLKSKSVRITVSEGGDGTTTLKNCGDSAVEDLRGLSSEVTSLVSGDVQASCCSSNGSITEKLESADLEVCVYEPSYQIFIYLFLSLCL